VLASLTQQFAHLGNGKATIPLQVMLEESESWILVCAQEGPCLIEFEECNFY